jgi:hypothetical protein
VARIRDSARRKAAKEKGYRSGFEQRIAEQLEASGVPFEYEPRREIVEYVVNETRRYLPDFVLRGSIIIECKGRFTAADRKKLLLLKAQHPEKDIRLLFMYDNKLSPRSPTRYSAWAEKNGIPWALKTVPEEWVK